MKQLTLAGCCDIVNITRGIKHITLGNYGFKVQVDYCSNCGSMKATSHIKEHKIMAGDTLFAEKVGQKLKVEIFETENGCGTRFFINEEFIKEEIYEDKSIHWARSVAENWIDGIKTLNG
jgi:hypothetical protein